VQPVTLEDCDDRKRFVLEGVRVDPVPQIERAHRLVVVPERALSADHGAHARAADGVDRHATLLQGADHADVREAPCASAAEHEPYRAS
jgi:hypothetical protein